VVLEKLRDADLPDGVTPALGPLATPVGELYRYVIDAPGYDSVKVREFQDWVIEPRFLQVPGVADVVPFGGLIKQYQVEIDPLALEKYKLSISQIGEAVNASNQNAGGALIDNRQQAMVVRGVGLIQSVADIENSVVTEANGVPVFVRDVGTVKIGAAPQTGIFGLGRDSGGGAGVLDAIREALEVESPIFFSLLIIVSEYIPLFTLERVERRLFTPMAFTVCYALLGSMLLALTLIPVLATYLFRMARRAEKIRCSYGCSAYERSLRSALGHPRKVLLGAGAVAHNDEVRLVSSQTGRNNSGTDPYGPNRNEVFVALKLYNIWPRGSTKPKLIDRLSEQLREQIPGASFSFTQPIIDNVTEAVTGSPADLAVIISGPDLIELRRLAN
jgi:Cu/Ag efflux pump CusA